MTRKPLIRFEGVELGYERRPRVLVDLDLTVLEGDFLGIVGPNGAGKSTLLKAILGLLEPVRGTIAFAGDAGARGRFFGPVHELHMGYVPQRQALDPLFPLRAIDIVVMGLYREIRPPRRPGRDAWARAERALAHAGVAELAEALYRDLSGGQQQRTLVARALVSDPWILVLDEPTNDLDLVGEKGIMDLITRLHEEGKTVLFVSHLLNVVANYVERLAVIREGRLEIGPVEAMLTSARLTELYGIPVEVARSGAQRVVLPERARPRSP